MKGKVSHIVKHYGIVLVLFVEILVFSFAHPAFGTFSNAITILRQASIVGICSVGMLFVLITGGINLATGWTMSLSGMIASVIMVNMGLSPWIAVLATFAAAIVVGLIMGLIIAGLKIAPFVVTMAFMNVLKGLCYLITDGKNVYGLPDSFNVIGQGYVGPIPIPVILMALAMFIGWFILQKTYFGRYFYAIGGNEEAALLSGIPVVKTKIATYIISNLYGAFAGLVMLGRIKTGSPVTGSGYEFDAIIACVLGGVSMAGGAGKIYHVLVGTLIVAIMNNAFVILQVSEYIQVILEGVILLFAIIYDVLQRRSEQKVVQSGK